jgi:hypothetical protein
VSAFAMRKDLDIPHGSLDPGAPQRQQMAVGGTQPAAVRLKPSRTLPIGASER